MALMSEFEMICQKYGKCPECNSNTTIEPLWAYDYWLARIDCLDCYWGIEIELEPHNEAAVRY